jgi:molybdopterin molybdotransferase
MISPQEADQLLSAVNLQTAIDSVPIAESLGKILAEDILADRDFPPYHRVTMDGIAIQHTERNSYTIQGIQYAGQKAQTLLDNTFAIEVMTGCILPINCDTVIRYEDLAIENGTATLIYPIAIGKNIHYQGEDKKANDVLIRKGTTLNASHIAILAAVGKANVLVELAPKIAIIATGDELVTLDKPTLAQQQIRPSNMYAILALLQQKGLKATCILLGDTKEEIEPKIKDIVRENDIIISTGAVSMGKKDELPSIYKNAQIHELFYKIAQKPGKPMWVGTGQNKIVFALPGNPVSSFMCTVRYVLPFLAKLNNSYKKPHKVKFVSSVEQHETLTLFKAVNKNGTSLEILNGHGSGDFTNLIAATGFIELPSKQSESTYNGTFDYWPW